MYTIWKVVIFISLYSSNSAHPSVPSIVVHEGQSAEISCLAKGNHDAYFWWKGEYLHNSTEIASFVGGIPSGPSGSYKATENGTLIIKKVSLDDEGKYICRVLSELSDCNGEILVYVQASIPDFALDIDLCDGDASCVIQIAPSKSTTLTCQATDASPSMKLKWFNGSTEITEGIEFEDPVMTGTSRVISATINVAPECAGSLICQAVDPKTKDDGGRFAHVQLELPGSAIKEASTGWMVISVIFLVTCIILIAAFAFIIVKSSKTKGKEKSKQEEGEQLMEVNKDRELKARQQEIDTLTTKFNDKDSKLKAEQEKVEELTTKFNDKDSKLKAEQEKIKELATKVNDKDSKLKAEQEKIKELTTKFNDKEGKLKAEQEKVKELTTKFNDKDSKLKAEQEKVKELATKISEKDSEIKSKDEHIMELTKKVYDATSDLKVKDVSAKAQTQIKNNELQVKVRELTKLQEEVNKKDNEITRLEEIIQSQGNAIKKKDEDLSRLKALESKSKDISSKHEAAVKDKKESQTKLEKIKSDEEQMKINFRRLENSERSFRAKKMDNLGNNYVTVIPKEGSLVSIKNVGKGFTFKHSGNLYKFPHIFSTGAAAREIYEKVNCYVENAVDGGDSLVIAFGTSRSNPQFTTMYGDTEWKSAILPLTFKKIFERADQLKTRKYAVKIRSRFVHVLENEKQKETFKVPESTFADGCKDPMTIPSTESKDENSIERLFIEHRESITKGSSKHNCFVQFVINTEEENNTITTGTITLATLLDARIAKSTFEKEGLKSHLEQFLTDIAYKANSRCLILAHLNEDKDDVKEVVKVAKTIAEGKKK